MTEPTPWSPQRISFNRDDGLPKYVAIARALALAITEQELQPGATLPSQKELAESFGVTIMTVRQALQTLTEQGLVSTEQGKGTYVRMQPYRLAMGPLASFAEQIRASGRELVTKVLGHGPITVSPLEQRRMQLESPEAFELVRLRVVDGEPLVLQSSLLPLAVAERLDVEQLASRSLYEMLLTDAGIRVGRATETVQATNLDAESARLLRREQGEAALLSARLTFDTDDHAVVDDRALTAGDSVVVAADRRLDERGLELVLSDDAAGIADRSPFTRGDVR
ncbi:GntR family transcriptional regulator [Tessaracoccus sp. OS52]|uniref:GntR family transcriptional regulator n=1 Tax=Tessaracoccus sp. OS52 TaxID=2886691 RepID=UPI001D109405|nr:GntR family transcriptional regulator [Tessaracoccus sp. OS52]MCC2592926.1 GntR family transcriptional regulator [Tessaracoccus sp. OS52]